MGALSDRYGRKPLLLISLASNTLGYSLCLYSIATHMVSFFFVGHIIAGLTGATLSITQSAIADVSDDDSKPRRFGLIFLALGVGAIIAPLIGGHLVAGSPPLYAIPFRFALGLAFFNIFITLLFFSETRQRSDNTSITPFFEVHHIFNAFKIPKIRMMFVVAFFFSIGWNCFIKFFHVFLIDKFAITSIGAGRFFAYFGLWMIVSQIIIKPLSKRWMPQQTMAASAFSLALCIPLLLMAKSIAIIFAIFPAIIVLQGLIYPNTIAFISNNAPSDMQGNVLGIAQSIQALGKSFGPAIAGALSVYNTSLPFMVASILVFAGGVVFMKYLQKQEAFSRG